MLIFLNRINNFFDAGGNNNVHNLDRNYFLEQMAVLFRKLQGNSSGGSAGGGVTTVAVAATAKVRRMYRNKKLLDTSFIDGKNISYDMRKVVELIRMCQME